VRQQIGLVTALTVVGVLVACGAAAALNDRLLSAPSNSALGTAIFVSLDEHSQVLALAQAGCRRAQRPCPTILRHPSQVMRSRPVLRLRALPMSRAPEPHLPLRRHPVPSWL